jgi:hypothetical protein
LDAVRIWLLGGFRASVGSRTIARDAWRIRKAAALVKILAMAPHHRLHRERAMELLWPDSSGRAASNSLPAHYPARSPQGPRPGRGLALPGERGRITRVMSRMRPVG